MEEYISKKEVLKLIRSWWRTTVYVSKEPVVIKAIKELPTIKADDGVLTILERYKLRIPPTVYDELVADIMNMEGEE